MLSTLGGWVWTIKMDVTDPAHTHAHRPSTRRAGSNPHIAAATDVQQPRRREPVVVAERTADRVLASRRQALSADDDRGRRLRAPPDVHRPPRRQRPGLGRSSDRPVTGAATAEDGPQHDRRETSGSWRRRPSWTAARGPCWSASLPVPSACRFRPGAVIVRQGDVADALYVVVAGRCAVAIAGRARDLATWRAPTLQPGDVLGEIGLLRGIPRTATVTAVEPTNLLKIDGSDFLAAVEQTGAHPTLQEASRIRFARTSTTRAKSILHSPHQRR
jgi:Cyclic nucleotide-binding domain